MKIKFLTLAGLTACLLFLSSCDRSGDHTYCRSGWEISQISINYAKTPINVTDSPDISWILSSSGYNQKQAAYRVSITESNSNNILWDSGKRQSSQSSHIRPSIELQSNTDYRVKLLAWNTDGKEASATTSFSTALMRDDEWKAQWIGLSNSQDSLMENRSQCLRKDFVVRKKIKRARIFVCGLGFYELMINGKKVGDHVLAPAKTRYSDRVLYEVFDAEKLLKKGENTIGVHLGNGWYNTNEKYHGWQMPFYGLPRAIVQLHVEYNNGQTETFCSDETWKASFGPVVFNSIYDGESYNATLEMPGWDSPGFDDSQWEKVCLMETPCRWMQPQEMQPERVIQTVIPEKTFRRRQMVVYDMGQNFSGWMRIKVKGEKGASVTIRHAELLNDADTTLNTSTNWKALNTDIYTLKGKGIELYEPSFTWHGFRYAEISVQGNAEILAAEGRIIHTDVAFTGRLETDNELINRIHHCSFWSQIGNMHGLPLDCPQRDERLGWLGDAYVTADKTMMNFDSQLFYRKWLDDIRFTQDSLGRIPHISPTKSLSEWTTWSGGYVWTLWEYYRNYGDLAFLEQHYNAVCNYVDYLETNSENYILPRDRYGDWLTPAQDNRDATGWVRGGPESATTAMFYACTDIVSQFARILDNKADEDRYNNLKKQIRKAYNDTFLDEANSVYTGEDYHFQYSQCLPLYLNITPCEHREKVMENLVNDIMVHREGHAHVGIIGSFFLVRLFEKTEHNDLVYSIVTKKGYPGWDYLTKGFTTLPENWNRGGSLNHPGFGNIDGWFFRSLAGIQTDEKYPGYERFIIKPYFPKSGLDRVDASIRTIKGDISSSWIRKGSQIDLTLVIPVNTRATVILPPSENITINNEPVNTNEYSNSKNSHIELGSGNYNIIINSL